MKITSVGWNRILALGLVCAAAFAAPALRAEQFKEELHQTYALSENGVVSLGNVNGSIRIEAWDRPEVKLDAVKSSRNKEQLDAVKIEIDSKPGHLTIHTKYPNSKGWGKNNNTSVAYTLKVPKGAELNEVSSVNGSVDISDVSGKVHASTVNGALNAQGLASDTKLSTVNGALKAAFASFDAVTSVSVSTVNGHVQLDLPAKANADLSLSTVNGSISGDVPVKKNWPIGKEVKTQLGEGGTKVKGSTVNGGMRVTVAKS